jgi:hypothetical protein
MVNLFTIYPVYLITQDKRQEKTVTVFEVTQGLYWILCLSLAGHLRLLQDAYCLLYSPAKLFCTVLPII